MWLYLPREVFFGRLGLAGAFFSVGASDFGRFLPATAGSFRLSDVGSLIEAPTQHQRIRGFVGCAKAKIADRKVSPHDGGVTALSRRFRFESGAFRVGADREGDRVDHVHVEPDRVDRLRAAIVDR
jgi:hypothetical protein